MASWGKFTMEEDFYRGRLVEKHGLDVIIPNRQDREIVHRVIYVMSYASVK